VSKNRSASYNLAVDLQGFRVMEKKFRWMIAGAVVVSAYWFAVRPWYLNWRATRQKPDRSWIARRRNLKLMTNPA
jgi:hypothetical protein